MKNDGVVSQTAHMNDGDICKIYFKFSSNLRMILFAQKFCFKDWTMLLPKMWEVTSHLLATLSILEWQFLSLISSLRTVRVGISQLDGFIVLTRNWIRERSNSECVHEECARAKSTNAIILNGVVSDVYFVLLVSALNTGLMLSFVRLLNTVALQVL